MSRVVPQSTHLWWTLLVLPALLLYAMTALGSDPVAPDAALDVLEQGEASTPRTELLGIDRQSESPEVASLNAERRREGIVADEALSATRPTTLEGRVLDSRGHGLAAARVTLSRSGLAASDMTDALSEIVTGEGGAFRFLDVPEGRLRVLAVGAAHGPAWAADVEPGTWIELRLSPAARLDVEVRGRDETLVADAEVSVQRPGFLCRKATDAEGRAAFQALPTGPVEVRVNTSSAATAPLIIQLSADEPSHIVCTLSPARSIKGRVVRREGGQPVEGATVTIRPAASSAAGEVACTTNGDGSFEFETTLASADRAALCVRKDGYAEGRAPLPPADAGKDLEIALIEQRLFAGRAIDAEGRPIAGARLAWATALDDTPAAVSDRHGRFQVSLPPSPSESGVYALLGLSGKGRYGATAVRLGPDLQPIRIVLRAGGRITGRVMDATGRPVPAALIGLQASGEHVYGLATDADEAWARHSGLSARADLPSAVSDDNGLYYLTSVPAGAWTVRIVHGAHDLRHPEPVLLGENEQVSLDLTVGEVGPLFGRVVDNEGRPVAGARVLLDPQEGDLGGFATTSATDGGFRFEAIRADLPHSLTASASGFAPLHTEPVCSGEYALEIRLQPPARIEGRLEIDGAPYEKPVDLWLVQGRTRGTDHVAGGAIAVPAQRYALTQSRGKRALFELAVPRAGPWLLHARSRDGKLAAEPTALRLMEGNGVDGLVLVLRPTATLYGGTRPNAVVSVHTWSGNDIVASPLASVRADGKGTFQLQGLPEGPFQVRVAFPEGDTTEQEVVLTSGTSTEIDIRPQPAPAERNGG